MDASSTRTARSPASQRDLRRRRAPNSPASPVPISSIDEGSGTGAPDTANCPPPAYAVPPDRSNCRSWLLPDGSRVATCKPFSRIANANASGTSPVGATFVRSRRNDTIDPGVKSCVKLLKKSVVLSTTDVDGLPVAPPDDGYYCVDSGLPPVTTKLETVAEFAPDASFDVSWKSSE